MRYIADHDFHIHSTVSACCRDDNQTPSMILKYAQENNLHKVCLTNHLWDEAVKSEAEWHPAHTYSKLKTVLPLPQADGVQFLFGAETDIDYNNVLGVSPDTLENLDFVTVATTHLHLTGNTVKSKIEAPEEGAEIWLDKLQSLLKNDLPWHKTGIAHLTCGHIMGDKTPQVIQCLSDRDLYGVFEDCAQKGVGIELNIKTLSMTEEAKKILLRPYYIAKDCGCKFYLGSDSHKTEALKNAKANFENIITLLDLQEEDKFVLAKLNH